MTRASTRLNARVTTRTKRALAVLASATVLGAPAITIARTATAQITGTSGQITKIAAPMDLSENVLESDTTLFAFDEQQNLVLPAPVNVDVTQPGQVVIAD